MTRVVGNAGGGQYPLKGLLKPERRYLVLSEAAPGFDCSTRWQGLDHEACSKDNGLIHKYVL